jgi:hypothetical protein
MPEPAKHESLKDYVARFMGDKRDRKWPKKQRAAIAYSEYKRKHKK